MIHIPSITILPVFWLMYMDRLYYRSRLEHKIKSLLISYLEHTDDITVPKWASALIPSLKYSILVISFKSSFVWYYIYPSWSWKHGSILLYFVTLATTWCNMFQHQFRMYITYMLISRWCKYHPSLLMLGILLISSKQWSSFLSKTYVIDIHLIPMIKSF